MKSLFSNTLMDQKWVVTSASIVVCAASVGMTAYESTKKTVELTLDGEKKVIRTHADTVSDVFEELHLPVQPQDDVYPAKKTKVKNNTEIVWKPAQQIVLQEDQEKQKIWTTAETVGDLLNTLNITITEHDIVAPKSDEVLQKGMKVTVKKAFPITIHDGENQQEVWSTSTTVADFLKQQGITLNLLDRVQPQLEETVIANGVVSVIRVEKVTDVVEEPIRFAVVTQQDATLPKGTEKVITEGEEGLVSRQYEIIKENGKEVARILLSEQKVKEKVDKVVAVGTNTDATQVMASQGIEGGKDMYVTSTAYTANCNGCSGNTATGINLRANPNAKVIAVDPNVIPLGTKVYVEGYGYAVAADTGGAVKGNKIDVFFPSTSDAYQWGRKTVKIKILY